MKKFSVVVTRTDEYEVELDETILNENWMSDFVKKFYPFRSLRDHAEHLASFQARFGSDGNDFIEGYGYVMRNGKLPHSFDDFDEKGNWKPEEERRMATPGINIKIVEEDAQIECEVTQLK